ncbi:penicillin-binding protein [soil metagenome]
MYWRYRFILCFFFLLFSLVIGRLFYWQSVRAEELTMLGQQQYGSRLTLLPKRGEIKTSDGYAIAANKISYLVFANPKEIKDIDHASETLSPLLEVEQATISGLLHFDKFWVPLAHNLSNDKKESVEKNNISGVGFEEQSVRFYPEASMAARLLGFVGKDEKGENKGYFGLEGYYDRQLRGKAGTAVQIHDALGHPILAKMNDKSGEIDGRDLKLNIDRMLQFVMEQELKDGIELYGAESGMAAAMDPKTGNILAMASFPTFDPRSFNDYSGDLYKNPFITDTYEPGSTFKPLVMAAAIDAGLVKPDTKCPICAGPVSIGGYDIHTWNDKYTADETMTEVIVHSDNTGMVFSAQKLGLDRMISYLSKFGIGDTTGIDLEGEAEPISRPRDSWYPIDLATASFGQGIVVTPIELLTAFTALANGGKRMEPHVVSQIETPEGEIIKITPKVLSTPISSKTAKIMTEMLVSAIDNGESKWAKPKGYRIAGKTGTAQIPIAGHYDPTQTIPSFIGYAPAEDPKFVMLVILSRPTKSIYGAETAAPIFFNIAKKMLNYYGVTPTE